MTEFHLRVILPRNRVAAGTLRVERAGVPVREFPVLGRSAVGRTSMLASGNTPTGTYQGDAIRDTSSWNQRSYGPWGAVHLRPIGGDALAAEALGRRGLLIHGGDPGVHSALRPTYGCLRLSNADMKDLVELLQEQTSSAQSSDHMVVITVQEF